MLGDKKLLELAKLPFGKKIVSKCHYDVLYFGTVIPQVIRRGVLTAQEAAEIAKEYKKYHLGEVKIFITQTEQHLFRSYPYET